MLIIEISGKDYECPQSWADITLSKYIESSKVLSKMPAKLYTLTFGSEEERNAVKIENNDNLEFASFYKKWVSFFCNIPEEIVGLLPVHVEDGIGVINLYNQLTKFMVMPSESECPKVDRFIFEGTEYMLPESTISLSMEEQPMANSIFDEFYEAMELKRVQGEIKNGNMVVLPLLISILYRPAKKITKGFFKKEVSYKIEPYDSVSVTGRSVTFLRLPMDKVWACYFFFIQSKNMFIKNTIQSLKEEAVKKQSLVSLDGM